MKNQLVSAVGFAKSLKNTVFLFKRLWKENTTLLLHAPQSVDKTAMALDIVGSLGRKVVYVNTSNSLDNHVATLDALDNMSVFTPQFESPEDMTDYADMVIRGIEEIIDSTDNRTFIVDSVTRIAALSFGRNASPAYVMKRLVALQIRRNVSLLVIAHDSTKSSDRALLALADCELSPAVGECDASAPDTVVADKVSPALSGDISPVSASAEIPVSVVCRKNLSRRERRLLRRQKQTLNR